MFPDMSKFIVCNFLPIKPAVYKNIRDDFSTLLTFEYVRQAITKITAELYAPLNLISMTVTYKGLDCVKDKNTTAYAAFKKISQTRKHAWAYQNNYALYVIYFGAALTFVGISRYIFHRWDDWSYRNGSSSPLGRLKKLLALTRVVGYKRVTVILLRITGLPSSFGTIVILITSLILVLCCCFVPHFWYRECRGFGSPPLAVRAGLQVMALTPFLIIMSGKTNFISFVTGMSYEKLNIFDQAFGWGCFFLSMVHTIPFLIQSNNEGNLRDMWNSELVYRNGVPPLVLLFVLCFLSTRFTRRVCYEAWWHMHWIVGVAYIALLTWHVYPHMNHRNTYGVPLGSEVSR